MIVDTHIHLSHFSFNCEFPFLSSESGNYVIKYATRDQLVELFKTAGIDFCIEPAIDLSSNRMLLDLAERFHGFLFSSVGIHPKRVKSYYVIGNDGKPVLRKLKLKHRKIIRDLSCHPSVVAIGETGLDYHLPKKERHILSQKSWFKFQLKLAGEKGVPVILHIRDAEADALRILKKHRNCIHGGVCHCFCGSSETARAFTELGLKIGIGGALLANNTAAKTLEETVIQTSLNDILLETDGPYVKPYCPYIKDKQLRKVRNTSLILPAVAERIAELKKVPYEEVLRVTEDNAVSLFGLPNNQ